MTITIYAKIITVKLFLNWTELPKAHVALEIEFSRFVHVKFKSVYFYYAILATTLSTH